MRSLALALALLAPAVQAAGPAPVTSYPPDWPHRTPWKLNRELLLPETERIVFVVDVPRGAQPKKEALAHLASLAAKYGGRKAEWIRSGSPGAPSIRWIVAGKPEAEPRGSKDREDSLRYFSEIPTCPDGALADAVSYVFLRYLGQWGSSYGMTKIVTTDPSCGHRALPVIYLAPDHIERDRVPLMSRSYLEARALAHEYGHVLQLASNPAHGAWWGIVPYAGGAHCVNRACALAVPTAKALLKGQMLDYCAECLRDIEQAREHWLTGKEFPETYRLPQPDPAAHVARLKTRNFHPGGEAGKLIGYGKAAVPALIERMVQLPGMRPGSPQHYATRLVLRILANEDMKRQGLGAREVPYVSRQGDLTQALLDWWAQEAQRLMSGDDWELPRFMHEATDESTAGR